MKLKILLKKLIQKILFSNFVLKSKLRNKILRIRKKTNIKNIQINANKIIDLLKKEKMTKKNIGGYYPVNLEIDDLEILKEFEKRKFNISLPKVKENFNMDFYKWSFSDPLIINKYGIPEPEINSIVYPDILLIPTVAFDKNLNRLGYGGGYYDRLIKKFSQKKKIIKIGLALADQKIDKVPINLYDQKLKISNKVQDLENKVTILIKKLENNSFIKKAPKLIVQKEKNSLLMYKIELKKLNSILNSIKN